MELGACGLGFGEAWGLFIGFREAWDLGFREV